MSFAERVFSVVASSPGGSPLHNPSDLLDALVLTFFIGFFAAMALVNIITGWVLRSVASWTYAALMAAMVAILLFSITHHIFGGNVVHAVLFCAYLVSTVGFAFALLRTWQNDRPMGWIVTGVLAINIPLVFAEFCWVNRGSFVSTRSIKSRSTCCYSL